MRLFGSGGALIELLASTWDKVGPELGYALPDLEMNTRLYVEDSRALYSLRLRGVSSLGCMDAGSPQYCSMNEGERVPQFRGKKAVSGISATKAVESSIALRG